jgi:hypothetical protein
VSSWAPESSSALAGLLAAPLRGVNPEMGGPVLIEAFVIIVMGHGFPGRPDRRRPAGGRGRRDDHAGPARIRRAGHLCADGRRAHPASWPSERRFAPSTQIRSLLLCRDGIEDGLHIRGREDVKQLTAAPQRP